MSYAFFKGKSLEAVKPEIRMSSCESTQITKAGSALKPPKYVLHSKVPLEDNFVINASLEPSRVSLNAFNTGKSEDLVSPAIMMLSCESISKK